MSGIQVQSGQVYWVQINGDRLKLRAVEKAQQIPGWWRCLAPLGTEIMVPESAFQQAADDLDFRP